MTAPPIPAIRKDLLTLADALWNGEVSPYDAADRIRVLALETYRRKAVRGRVSELVAGIKE